MSLPTPSFSPADSFTIISTGDPTATPTATDTPNPFYSNNTSFVGNTPSTVLFFLALTVGVVIAVLFVFFTLRYFVRARYGLHAFSITRRNVLLSSLDSLESIDDQWEFISLHHDYLASRLQNRYVTRSGNIIAINRRRRRRGRFSKMKKLTPQEVEHLFPKKTYTQWLSSGRKDYTNILEEEQITPEIKKADAQIDDEEDSNNIELTSIVTARSKPEDFKKHEHNPELFPSKSQTIQSLSIKSIDFQIEKHSKKKDSRNYLNYFNEKGTPSKVDSDDQLQMAKTLSSTFGDTVEKNEIPVNKSLNEVSITDDNYIDYDLSDPHYTSGSCAICLDIIEDEDEVRGLICGHVFHSDCVDPWLTKRRACCPMCKRDYYKNEDNNQSSSISNGNSNDNDDTNDNHASIANNDANSTHPNDDDIVGFDFETFRADPMVRAMLQELIPPSERVRLILADVANESLNLEERARIIADKKYSSLFKRIWWHMMGISKDDLYHWAVLEFYKEHRLEMALNRNRGTSEDTTGDRVTAVTGSDDDHNAESEEGVDLSVSRNDISSSESPYSDASQRHSDDIVSNRV